MVLLINCRAFEERTDIRRAGAETRQSKKQEKGVRPQMDADVIIVPAAPENFQKGFIQKREWKAINIPSFARDNLKYIAAYQTQPISAITHIAKIDRIEPFGDKGKFRVVLKEEPEKIEPIPFGKAPKSYMIGPRLTKYDIIIKAKDIGEIFKAYHTP